MSKIDELAIVLVSGGMDSLAVAAIAHEKFERLSFLHFVPMMRWIVLVACQ